MCVCFCKFIFQSAKSIKQTAAKWTRSGGALSDFPPFSTTFGLTPRVTPFPHISETQAAATVKRTIFRKFKKEKSGGGEGLRGGEGRCELNWVEIIMMSHHLGRGGLLRRADPDFRPLTCHRKRRRWSIAHHRAWWNKLAFNERKTNSKL